MFYCQEHTHQKATNQKIVRKIIAKLSASETVVTLLLQDRSKMSYRTAFSADFGNVVRCSEGCNQFPCLLQNSQKNSSYMDL